MCESYHLRSILDEQQEKAVCNSEERLAVDDIALDAIREGMLNLYAECD